MALRVEARSLHQGGGSGRREGGSAAGGWQGGQDGRQGRGWHDYARVSKVGLAAALGGAAFVLGDSICGGTPVAGSQCEESGWYTEPRDKAKGRDKDQMPIAETERVIYDFYEVLEELGSGVHASVRMGKNKQTGERVAVKCVDKANMRRRQLAREIEILTTVNHPNVISLKDVFEDKTYVYLVLELVEVRLPFPTPIPINTPPPPPQFLCAHPAVSILLSTMMCRSESPSLDALRVFLSTPPSSKFPPCKKTEHPYRRAGCREFA